MKVFTIFGNPVSHSKSPQMHNNSFKAHNIPYCYSRNLLLDGSELKNSFLNANFTGANITVPHKEIAYSICDVIEPEAQEIGAINTLINRDGKIYGYNTDAPGFVKSIEEFSEVKNILIIGAGGTARAISIALKNRGYNVTVLNRTKKRLEFFISKNIRSFSWDDFEIEAYDMIVNTTSAGLSDSSLPLEQSLLIQLFSTSKYAIDIIYGKETPFLDIAKQNNQITKDGKDMLLFQGVLAHQLFTDNSLDIQSVTKYMRQGLEL